MFLEWRNKTWLRLKSVWKRRQLDRDLSDEVAFHLAMREEKNRLAGINSEEARYAARREFGNATSFKESAHSSSTGIPSRSLASLRWSFLAKLCAAIRRISGCPSPQSLFFGSAVRCWHTRTSIDCM